MMLMWIATCNDLSNCRVMMEMLTEVISSVSLKSLRIGLKINAVRGKLAVPLSERLFGFGVIMFIALRIIIASTVLKVIVSIS